MPPRRNDLSIELNAGQPRRLAIGSVTPPSIRSVEACPWRLHGIVPPACLLTVFSPWFESCAGRIRRRGRHHECQRHRRNGPTRHQDVDVNQQNAMDQRISRANDRSSRRDASHPHQLVTIELDRITLTHTVCNQPDATSFASRPFSALFGAGSGADTSCRPSAHDSWD